MRSDRQLFERDIRASGPREQEAIPNGQPLSKPHPDRSIERKSRELLKQRPVSGTMPRAVSPQRPVALQASSSSRESLRQTDSKSVVVHLSPSRDQVSGPLQANPLYQTQIRPAFSQTFLRASTPSSKPANPENDVQRGFISPQPQMAAPLQQSQQILQSQQMSLHSSHMSVNNSRASELFTQKDEVVRKYRQKLEDKEGRLKNYEAKVSSLEGQLEDHDLERKANIILAGYFTEICRMVDPYEELSLDALKQKINQLLAQNKKLKHQLDNADGPTRLREQQLTEEFERIIQKYNQESFKKNQLEISVFDLTRELKASQRQVQDLKSRLGDFGTKEQLMQSQRSYSPPTQETAEAKNLRIINQALEREVEKLRGKLMNGSSLSIRGSASLGEIDILRAKILALQMQLESKNQQVIVLSSRIKQLQQQRIIAIAKSNDSLSYSLQQYGAKDFGQSHIKKIRDDDNSNSTSAIRIINQLRGTKQEMEVDSGSQSEKQLQKTLDVRNVEAFMKNKLEVLQSEHANELQRVNREWEMRLEKEKEMLRVVKEESREQSESVIHQRREHSQVGTDHLRQRIAEMQQQQARSAQHHLKQKQDFANQMEELTMEIQNLKDQKLKLQLRILQLEKQNQQIDEEAKKMWNTHKKQFEAEREKMRIQAETAKQTELLLKKRIGELEGVPIGDEQQEDSLRDQEDKLKRYQSLKIQAAEFQNQVKHLRQTETQLKKTIITRDSQIEVLKQQVDGMIVNRKLLQDQLSTRHRTTSINQQSSSGDQSNMVQQYRQQLSGLQQKLNLLTVQNSKLRLTQQNLKLDIETMRRHLQQTSSQMDSLISQLEQARQNASKLSQTQYMVQELTRQLQSAQSDVKVDDGVAKQLEEEFILRRTLEEENSGLKLKRQELEKELQRVVKTNEEQIKAFKVDIANLEQFLNKAREEIERFQVEGHQVKQTLGKEREMQEEERQKQSEQLQDIKVEIEKLIKDNRVLEQQKQTVQSKLKTAQQQIQILKQAQNVFKKTSVDLQNQSSSVLRSYEQQIKLLKKQLSTSQANYLQLQQTHQLQHRNSEQQKSQIKKSQESLKRSFEQNLQKYSIKEEQVTLLKKNYQSMEKIRIELEGQVEKMTGDIIKLRASEDGLNRRVEEMTRLYQKINQEKIQEAEKFMKELGKERQARIDALRNLQQGLTQQERDKITKLQQESNEKITTMTREFETLKSQYSLLNQEHSQFKARFTREKQSSYSEIESLTKRFNEIKVKCQEQAASIQQLTFNNNHLQQYLSSTKRLKTQSQQNLSQTIKTLQKQLFQSTQQNNSLSINLRRQTLQLQTATKQISIYQQSSKQLQKISRDKTTHLSQEMEQERVRLQGILKEQETKYQVRFEGLKKDYVLREREMIAKIGELEAVLDQLRAVNRKLQDQNQANKEKFEDGRMSLQKLQGMFRGVEQQHLNKISELENIIQNGQRNQTVLESKIMQLDADLTSSKRECRILHEAQRSHLARISELEGSLEDLHRNLNETQQVLRDQLRLAKQESADLKQDNGILKDHLQAAQRKGSEAERTAAIVRELQTVIDRLKADNTDLRLKQPQYIANMGQLDNKNSQLNETNRQLLKELQQLRQRITQLQTVITNLQKQLLSSQQRQQQAQQAIARTSQLPQLHQKINSLSQVNRSLQTQNSQLHSSNEHLTIKLAQITQQYEYLERENTKLQGEVRQLTTRYQSSSQIITNSTNQVRFLNEQNGKLNELLQYRTEELTSVVRGKEAYERRIAELQIVLDSKEKELREVRDKIKELMESKGRALPGSEDWENQKSLMDQMAREQNNRVDPAMQTLQTSLQQTYEKELVQLRQAVKNYEHQMNSVMTERATLLNQRTVLQQELYTRNSQINQLKSTVENIEALNTELVTELKSYIRQPSQSIKTIMPSGTQWQIKQDSQQDLRSVNNSSKKPPPSLSVQTQTLLDLPKLQQLLSLQKQIGQHLATSSSLKNELQQYNQKQNLIELNSSLQRIIEQMKRQIEDLQAKRDNSTDYSSLQESVKTLKWELGEKERKWHEQFTALKQIGLDLEKENQELIGKNQELEERLRFSQTESVNLKRNRTEDSRVQVKSDSRTEIGRSDRIKKEFRQIITDIHNKGLDRTEDLKKTGLKESDGEMQPRRPSILAKKGEGKEEYSLPKSQFSNPFEDFNQNQDLKSKPQVNGLAQNNNKATIVQQPQTPQQPQPLASSRPQTQTQIFPVRQTPVIFMRAVQPIRKEGSADLSRSRGISQVVQTTEQKRESSKGSINFVRVTQLSRQNSQNNGSSASNSLKATPIMAFSSPRNSQGPTQFVKKSVILTKQSNGQIVQLNSSQQSQQGMVLEFKKSGIRKETDTPYFSRSNHSSRVSFVKSQSQGQRVVHSESLPSPPIINPLTLIEQNPLMKQTVAVPAIHQQMIAMTNGVQSDDYMLSSSRTSSRSSSLPGFAILQQPSEQSRDCCTLRFD